MERKYNLEELDSLTEQELVSTEGGFMLAIAFVGLCFAAYEIGYQYGKDAAAR